MQLDVELDGFNQFAQAADDLSSLFTSFIVKLQNVSIINDTAFLTAIVNALAKIVNLSNVFGKFKETILATSTVEIPKSAHDTKVILQGVMDEINCAMQYITYFVAPTGTVPVDGELSATDKNIISSAVNTIDTWNTLCEQGVTIALTNSPDVQYINQANNELKTKTATLNNLTSALRTKFAFYNITK